MTSRRTMLLLGAFEHPDSASYYFWAGIITPLGLLGPLHFGLLIPLALAGILVLALRRRRVRRGLPGLRLVHGADGVQGARAAGAGAARV